MKKSQTLVSLLIIIAISIIIITTVLGLMMSNLINTSSVEQSTELKLAAESGMENGLLRLLRDPSYSGETLTSAINGYTTTITVSGDSVNKTLISTASSLTFQKKILVKITYNNNQMVINLWQDSQ